MFRTLPPTMMRYLLPALLALTLLPPRSMQAQRPIRVLVWDERQPAQKTAYTNFLGNAIAAHLEKAGGLNVRSVSLDSPDQGFDAATLDTTDVLVWWGHVRQTEVKAATVQGIVERVKAGRLALVALHSAHWSQPFVALMQERAKVDARDLVPKDDFAAGKLTYVTPPPFVAPKRGDPLTPALAQVATPDGRTTWQLTLPNCCFPAYRGDGKPSAVRMLLPDHPIAKGLPAAWEIPQTEMYDEPFHVPKPDAVILEERWATGEHFRSGSLWQVGQGRVFYFRPGHETYPIYLQPLPLKVVENAVRWLGAGVL